METPTPKMGFERTTELEQVKLGDLLWDAHAAGLKLQEFTTNRTFADYESSELLQSIVAAMLGIMADRLAQLHRQFPAEYARIADADKLIATLDAPAPPAATWALVEQTLPEAVDQLRTVLEHWHDA